MEKNYYVEALTSNGIRIKMNVSAETVEDAELEAGRKLIESGFKESKIHSIKES